MVAPLKQLPLSLSSLPLNRFSNFIAGDNQWLIDSLNQALAGNGERLHYLWCSAGGGKSHILQASVNQVLDSGGMAAYIPLSDPELTPELLEGLEAFQLIALDDTESVLGDKNWEEALFHFFNRAMQQQCVILFSAAVPPAELNCQLADLKSRLAWCQVAHIAPLNDAGLIQIMSNYANETGLPIEEEVCRFILHRSRRNVGALVQLLDQLDSASLAEKRKVTIPFVKKVLAL